MIGQRRCCDTMTCRGECRGEEIKVAAGNTSDRGKYHGTRSSRWAAQQRTSHTDRVAIHGHVLLTIIYMSAHHAGIYTQRNQANGWLLSTLFTRKTYIYMTHKRIICEYAIYHLFIYHLIIYLPSTILSSSTYLSIV